MRSSDRDRLADRLPHRQLAAPWLATAACVALMGCEVGAPPPPQVPARELWATRAWPALGACAGCHATQPAIDFLAPGTPEGAYDTLLAYQPALVDVASPASSLLVAMGKHTGPALAPQAAAALLEWIEAEHAERVPPPEHPIMLGPFALRLDVSTVIPLPIEGASLHLVAGSASGQLSLTELELRAGPRGLHAAHPVFSSRPTLGLPIVDTTDRYRSFDLTLPPNAVDRLGGGRALFSEFAPTDPITIHFRTLEAP